MQFTQAMIAKITVKKILSLLDHMQIVVTHALGEHTAAMTLQDWFDEMRLHLRKIEYSVEKSAE